MVNWTLTELKRNCREPLKIAEVIDATSIVKAKNENVISVSPANVNGFFLLDQLGVHGSFQIEATVVLPSTRSLRPVKVPLSFAVNEYYVDAAEHDLSRFEQTDVVIQLKDGLLDLAEVVADNLLVHLPIKVLTSEEENEDWPMPQGKDWRLVVEGQKLKASQTVDPRLAKLKDFFKKQS
ncbi:DUF177 domain-containing protein [Liquorilactobacillus sicerae]|uniref:DUF177 domain-containing protein n=1 Tax=Liquorilactobacillus sicerae TaxID=1416943 RepID=UPI00248186CE|nr:YceD family protein [Liquorilactobacillus sicerae]